MTGFGAARQEKDQQRVAVEVRSLNNRYLKVVVRGDEPYPMFEAEVERVVRQRIRRGTITVHINVERPVSTSVRWPVELLAAHLQQLRQICQTAGCPEAFPHLSAGLLLLPGLTPSLPRSGPPPAQEWELVQGTLEQALEQLVMMRQREGEAMARELQRLQQLVRQELAAIAHRLPQVQVEYHQRLRERLRHWLADEDIPLDEAAVLREVALLIERSDVSEELARLQSHLQQFAEIVHSGEEVGRKLEFLVQEMGREANTLGAKAADVEVSRHVVAIKTLLEKMRELVQNVE
jgi:uncharacterized protein (TIGR00255 family)